MGMTSSETTFNDEELITYLRFQGLDKDIAAADRIKQLVATNEQLNKNCEALSQLVDSVSESRDFWMSEFVERYVNG